MTNETQELDFDLEDEVVEQDELQEDEVDESEEVADGEEQDTTDDDEEEVEESALDRAQREWEAAQKGETEDKKAATEKKDAASEKHLDVESLKDKLVKVKVNGAEEEVSLQKVIDGYNHNAAAAKRMQEANDLNKRATEIIKSAAQDPWAVVQAVLDEGALSKESEDALWKNVCKWVADKAAYRNMPEKDRKALDNERELARLRKIEEERKTQEKQRQQEEYWSERMPQIGEVISEAIGGSFMLDDDKTRDLLIDYCDAAWKQEGFQKHLQAKGGDVAATFKDFMPQILKAAENSYIKEAGYVLGKSNRDDIIAHFNSLKVKSNNVENKVKKIIKNTTVPGVKKGQQTQVRNKQKKKVDARAERQRMIDDYLSSNDLDGDF